MARRFNELSVEEQEDFKRRAIAGETAFRLSEAFDLNYETARRNREIAREAYRGALPQGGTDNGNNTSAA